MKLSKQHLPSHFPIPLPNEMESSIPKAFSVQLETAYIPIKSQWKG